MPSKVVHPKTTTTDGDSFGLSIRPYLTENGIQEERNVRLYVKRYGHGEMLLRSFIKPSPDLNERRSKPPLNIGERVQEDGLSKRGKTRITRAGRYYQSEWGRANMITLGYGNVSMSDHRTSKGDLDRFNKSLNRYVANEYGIKAHYVWVAEIQEKRLERDGIDVIHYHILTPHYIPCKLISKWWNNAVNKPRVKKGLPTQELYPNVIKAYHAGKYIAKYCQKNGHMIAGNGYTMSQATSKAIRAVQQECFDISMSQLEDIKLMAQGQLVTDRTEYSFSNEYDAGEWVTWISNGNEFVFGEMLKYDLNGYESIKRNEVLDHEVIPITGIEQTSYERRRIGHQKSAKGSTGYVSPEPQIQPERSA